MHGWAPIAPFALPGAEHVATRTVLPELSPPALAKPHVLFLLIDDLGWDEVGYHKSPGSKDDVVDTPVIDSLVREGIELNRHYVHMSCSPSRSAIQSGRAPLHVNVLNVQECARPRPDGGEYVGVPENMTTMAELMKRGGYETHFVGKWDAGCGTQRLTPRGRGYETFVGYFGHSIDQWSYRSQCNPRAHDGCARAKRDLWGPADGPALELLNSASCDRRTAVQFGGKPLYAELLKGQGRCVYVDQLFEDRVIELVKRRRGGAEPLFVFWAPHAVHSAYQPPAGWDGMSAKLKASLKTLEDTSNPRPRAERGWFGGLLTSVAWMDRSLGRVVEAYKAHGLWNSTLLVASSDNGSPENNFPLRGTKYTHYEGGIRVPAFVAGGFVPAPVRGTTQHALIAGWDWYATLAALAAVSPYDDAAAAAGLPPIDSFDFWPLLSGATTEAPRQQLVLGSSAACTDTESGVGRTIPEDACSEATGRPMMDSPAAVVGIIELPWKLLLGQYGGWLTVDVGASAPLGRLLDDVRAGAWVPGVRAHNATAVRCADTPETGCLYHVVDDPHEADNRAAREPAVFARLLGRARRQQERAFSPRRHVPSEQMQQREQARVLGVRGTAPVVQPHPDFLGPPATVVVSAADPRSLPLLSK